MGIITINKMFIGYMLDYAWLLDFYKTDYCPWENLHPILTLFKHLFERIKYNGILDRFLVK